MIEKYSVIVARVGCAVRLIHNYRRHSQSLLVQKLYLLNGC